MGYFNLIICGLPEEAVPESSNFSQPRLIDNLGAGVG
jgi:hypothetical protein